MTVKEFIKHLLNCPLDADIKIAYDSGLRSQVEGQFVKLERVIYESAEEI